QPQRSELPATAHNGNANALSGEGISSIGINRARIDRYVPWRSLASNRRVIRTPPLCKFLQQPNTGGDDDIEAHIFFSTRTGTNRYGAPISGAVLHQLPAAL